MDIIMLDDSNKNSFGLFIRKNVVLTNSINPVIDSLYYTCATNEIHVEATSGLRTERHQMEIIFDLAKDNNLLDEFKNILPDVSRIDVRTSINYNGLTVFAWQPVWSRLLNQGIIINPPIPARVLFDYFKADDIKKLHNKKGEMIERSTHQLGNAVDTESPDIDRWNDMIDLIFTQNLIPNIKGFLYERKQDCVHIDCKHID